MEYHQQVLPYVSVCWLEDETTGRLEGARVIGFHATLMAADRSAELARRDDPIDAGDGMDTRYDTVDHPRWREICENMGWRQYTGQNKAR